LASGRLKPPVDEALVDEVELAHHHRVGAAARQRQQAATR
jgi:hypothetical protein